MIGRFATVLAAMNLLIFTLLSVAVLTGVASFRQVKLLSWLGLTTILAVGLVGGLQLILRQVRKEHLYAGRSHSQYAPGE